MVHIAQFDIIVHRRFIWPTSTTQYIQASYRRLLHHNTIIMMLHIATSTAQYNDISYSQLLQHNTTIHHIANFYSTIQRHIISPTFTAQCIDASFRHIYSTIIRCFISITIHEQPCFITLTFTTQSQYNIANFYTTINRSYRLVLKKGI